MKLINALLLFASAGFLIIGIHQTMVLGLMHSYWILMLSIILLFVYQLKKRAR